MTEIRQEVIELGLAIKRCSPLIADNLAVFSPPMNAEELKYLRDTISRDYICSLIFPRPTVGEIMEKYG